MLETKFSGRRSQFMKNDTIYLRHILEAIEKIEHYLLNTD